MTAELMDRAQAGDLDAFGQLYAEYRDFLLAVARKRMPDEAEDIVQDVFMRALANLHRWTDQGKNPRAWFAVITVNMCHDRAKSAYVRLVSPHSFDYDPADNADPELDPARIVERSETTRAVNGALPALTPYQRQAVVLHHLQGRSLADTAAALDSEVNTVKSTLFRARGSMRRVLADA